MAEELFSKVSYIKAKYPTVSSEIDRREVFIRNQVEEIAKLIKRFPQDEERSLVKILVTHGLQKVIEEILAEE